MARVTAVLALVLALLDDGWAGHAQAGEMYCEKNGEWLDPFDLVQQLAGRKDQRGTVAGTVRAQRYRPPEPRAADEGQCLDRLELIAVPCREANIKLPDRSSSAPMEVPPTRLALDDVLSGKQIPTAATQTGGWQIR